MYLRKFPLNSGRHPDPDFGCGLRIRTRFALAEVCALRVLLFRYCFFIVCLFSSQFLYSLRINIFNISQNRPIAEHLRQYAHDFRQFLATLRGSYSASDAAAVSGRLSADHTHGSRMLPMLMLPREPVTAGYITHAGACILPAVAHHDSQCAFRLLRCTTVAGSTVWNSLPVELRDETENAFRQSLKTAAFQTILVCSAH